MIALKIDVTKLDKKRFFHGKNGAIYADLILMENRDGPDQYGNTHFIAISATKEERAARIKLSIVGNGKALGGQSRPAPRTTNSTASNRQNPAPDDSYRPESEDIPF